MKEEHTAHCCSALSMLKKTFRSKPGAEEHSVSMCVVVGRQEDHSTSGGGRESEQGKQDGKKILSGNPK